MNPGGFLILTDELEYAWIYYFPPWFLAIFEEWLGNLDGVGLSRLVCTVRGVKEVQSC